MERKYSQTDVGAAMATVWNVSGAIAAQSAAHSHLERAIADGRAVHIYMGDCQITTCANDQAARVWIGKSKKYRIVPMASKP